MIASCTIEMNKESLLAALQKQGCELIETPGGARTILVPGWDRALLHPIAQSTPLPSSWLSPLLHCFWDRIELRSSAGAKVHQLTLRYWSSTNILLHLALSSLIVIGASFSETSFTQLQLVLVLCLANALAPVAARIQALQLFEELEWTSRS